MITSVSTPETLLALHSPLSLLATNRLRSDMVVGGGGRRRQRRSGGGQPAGAAQPAPGAQADRFALGLGGSDARKVAQPLVAQCVAAKAEGRACQCPLQPRCSVLASRKTRAVAEALRCFAAAAQRDGGQCRQPTKLVLSPRSQIESCVTVDMAHSQPGMHKCAQLPSPVPPAAAAAGKSCSPLPLPPPLPSSSSLLLP